MRPPYEVGPTIGLRHTVRDSRLIRSPKNVSGLGVRFLLGKTRDRLTLKRFGKTSKERRGIIMGRDVNLIILFLLKIFKRCIILLFLKL